MKRFLPVIVIIGVVSLVACAGLGSCADGTRVLAQDENRLMIGNPRRANYPTEPYNLGLFDYVDWGTQTVYRCTKYVSITSISPNDWVLSNTDNGICRFEMTSTYASSFNFDPVTTWCGLTSFRGFGSVSGGQWWSEPDITSMSNTVLYGLFWGNGAGLTFCIPTAWLSTADLQSFDEYVTSHPLHIQYASTVQSTESFGNANDGDNMQDAYEDGLDDYDVPITIHFSTFSGEDLVNPFRLEIEWWSDEIHYLVRDGSTFTLPQHIFGPSSLDSMDLRISIVSTNSSVRNPFGLELEIETLMSGDCAFDVSAGESFDKPLGLPYYEGGIDIYVNLVPDEDYGYQYENPYYDGSIYFVIDTNNPGLVNVGDAWGNAYYDGMDAVQSDIYEAGRSDGYQDGYNEGYSEGDSHGYRVGYNEGEAAVGEGGLVVANLFGAIAGVPITVLNGLSGLTIWSIPLISVLMSFMFLGIVIWVVKKFI